MASAEKMCFHYLYTGQGPCDSKDYNSNTLLMPPYYSLEDCLCQNCKLYTDSPNKWHCEMGCSMVVVMSLQLAPK